MAVPNREEVRDFLTTRRARLSPDEVEMPTGGNRRVPGLRRSEVLQDLIGELSTLSEDFRTKWGLHDVRRHASGEKLSTTPPAPNPGTAPEMVAETFSAPDVDRVAKSGPVSQPRRADFPTAHTRGS